MKNKTITYILSAVVLLIAGAWFWSSFAAQKYNEGVVIKENVKGNPTATVTLVEYSDFQCPACAGFQPLVKSALEQFGDNLRFEYKHFPLFLANPNMHKNSVKAALAAEAAGQQGKFFEYSDKLFENQKEWENLAVPEPVFVKYAAELDLDTEQFKRQMKSSILRDRIYREFREGAGKNITGTPTFFLNGRKMVFNSVEGFTGQIMNAINPGSASTTSGALKVKFGI